MPTIVVPANVPLCQVDDFPKACERSREGALYVRPASAMTVTQAELDHLKEHHADLVRRLIVVPDKPTKLDKAAYHDALARRAGTTLADCVAKSGDASATAALAERDKKGEAMAKQRAEDARKHEEMKLKQHLARAHKRAVAGAAARGEKPPTLDEFVKQHHEQLARADARVKEKVERKERGPRTRLQRMKEMEAAKSSDAAGAAAEAKAVPEAPSPKPLKTKDPKKTET